MKILKHKFVDYIPKEPENNTLYISLKYNTMVHLCCCGCRNKVVTPLSPAGWSLKYNGQTITIYPSIGNWNFDCKSHYWIKNNIVEWDEKWDEKWDETEIKNVRFADKQDRINYMREKRKPINKWFNILSQNFMNLFNI